MAALFLLTILLNTCRFDAQYTPVQFRGRRGDEGNISQKLESLQFNETTIVNGSEIGWIKLISCREVIKKQKTRFTFRSGYNLDAIRELLPYVMSVRISPPPNSSNYHDFALETIPCSSPVFAMTNAKEMSWILNEFTHKYDPIDYVTQSTHWMGSETAKARLQQDGNCKFYAENGDPRDFPVIYSSCDDYLQIDVDKERCSWERYRAYDTDIDIYFGFDKHKRNMCQFELDRLNVTYSDNFTFVPYELNHFEAEMFCEQNFNTTLAVLNTDAKVKEGLDLRRHMGYEHEPTWIGLYKEEDDPWQWFGAECAFSECDAPDAWVDSAVAAIYFDTYGCAYLEPFAVSSNSAYSYGEAYNRDHPINCVDDRKPFLCDRFSGIPEPDIICDFFHEEEMNITQKGFEIFTRNITIGSEMRISLDLKLDPNFICTAPRCNVFHVGSAQAIKLPSMYIVGDDIEVYMFNGGYDAKDFYSHKILNAVHLLRDGAYHRIDLHFSLQRRKYSIDNIIYFWSTGRSHAVVRHKYMGRTYPLFISNPWEESVDGMIKNLCFETNHDPQFRSWERLEHVNPAHLYAFEDDDASYYESEDDLNYSYPIAYYNEELIIITETDIYHRSLTEEILIDIATDGVVPQIDRWMDTDWEPDSENNTMFRHFIKNDTLLPPAKVKNYIENGDGIQLIMHSQQFIQDDNRLYVLMENDTVAQKFGFFPDAATNASNSSVFFSTTATAQSWDTNAQLYTFDLDQLVLQTRHIIPNEYYYPDFAFDSCVATNHTHLFIFNQGIIMYDITEQTYTDSRVSNYNLVMSGCAATIDNDAIFIFGGLTSDGSAVTDTVYEYDIVEDSIRLLDGIALRYPTYSIRAIASANNRIYLYGGVRNASGTAYTGWYLRDGSRANIRSIFNVQTRRFDSYHYTYDNQNRASAFATAIYDQSTNLLLRYKAERKAVSFLVVDDIAIDFSNTETMVWRTDVWLDYVIYSYASLSDQSLYKFELNCSNSTTSHITYILMIDPFEDICYLCEDMVWNADCMAETAGCKIMPHLLDTNMDAMQINITSINYGVEILHSTAFPLEIGFQKCTIRYDITPKTIYAGARVYISTEQSINCHSNPSIADGSGYRVHIYNQEARINHSIVVGTNDCVICDYGEYNCSKCEDGIQPFIGDALKDKGSFIITISPETIDLVISPQFQFEPISIAVRYAIPLKMTTSQIAGISLGSVGFIGLITAIIMYICAKNKKLAAEVQRQERHKEDISNPLVLMIGIANYLQNVEDKGLDVFCNDLDGVDVDYNNMKKLCKVLRYDFYPRALKLQWTQHEIMEFLNKYAEKANESLETEHPYDSVLVVCSGHGLQNHIITSDYQSICKDAVHRVFGANYPNLRELPRIFMFDCCDGEKQRHYMPSTYRDESDDDEYATLNTTERGKNIETNDVILRAHTEIWKSDQLNPDFKLVTVHGANVGFQAKIDLFEGSYLISTFVRKMNENIQQKQNLFFGDMMENIQHELHSKGKQQSVNTFNNHTRYLRFQRGEEHNEMTVGMEEDAIVNGTSDQNETNNSTPVCQE